MRINHNIAALNTYRQLTVNTTAGSKSLEKLSSGYRINRAGDDAAGLAISEKMRGQIRGLEQASRNSQDAISLIQTAEGALAETHSILQRMRELAVQSATDTNTDTDRKEIQKEIMQLLSELDRISNDTEFNTKKLLDGSISNSVKISATANAAKLTGAAIADDTLAAGDYTINVTSVTPGYDFEDVDTKTKVDNVEKIAAGNPGAADIEVGTYTLTLAKTGNPSDPNEFSVVLTNSKGQTVAQDTVTLDNGEDASGDAVLEIGGFKFTWNQIDDGEDGTTLASTVAEGSIKITVTMDATFSVVDPDGNVIGTKTIADNNTGKVNVGGVELMFNDSLAAGATTITLSTKAVKFQIGANEGQQTALSIGNMSAEALGVNAIDLSSREGASAAITTINDALEDVSAERAKLGAVQNRLEHTINNLDTSAENLTASESRIRDVDMAKEMMEFTKNSILQQAAQAMLAQANQQPQGVLQLLR